VVALLIPAPPVAAAGLEVEVLLDKMVLDQQMVQERGHLDLLEVQQELED